MADGGPHAADILRQVLESECGDEEVTFPNGQRFRVVRNPEPAVAVRLTGLDDPYSTLDFFDAASERPETYPADLPFILDTRAAVATMHGDITARTVQWWDVPDAPRLIQDLVRQSEERGWQGEQGPVEIQGPFPLTKTTLRRGDIIRTVVSLATREGGMVALADTAARQ